MLEPCQLGDLTFHPVGLGCAAIGPRLDIYDAEHLIGSALDAGLDFLSVDDHLGAGETQTMVGRCLRNRRDDVTIAATLGGLATPRDMVRLARPHVLSIVDHTLRRLDTDHLDLAVVTGIDGSTPLEEMLLAFGDEIRKGKIRQLGVADMEPARLVDVVGTSIDIGAPVAALDAPASVAERAALDELIPAAHEQHVTTVARRPLGAGAVAATDLDRRVESTQLPRQLLDELQRPTTRRRIEHLHDLAGIEGRDVTDLAARWLLNRPGVGAAAFGAATSDHIATLARIGRLPISSTLSDELDERLSVTA